jgi:hypothetical protein
VCVCEQEAVVVDTALEDVVDDVTVDELVDDVAVPVATHKTSPT